MKSYILAALLCLSTEAFTDGNLPSYVQVQVDNINMQISQLKTQRDQMMHELQASDASSIEHQQLQAQIDRLNNQISMLEKQVDALKKD